METETNTTLTTDDKLTAAGVHIIDASRRNSLPTGHVVLGNTEGLSDAELADMAGYGSRHFGYTVSRHDGAEATVHLWND